ncbi:MAG: hypothetical protein ABIQ39_05950 [Ilumatobacteraceae bacterium]
MRPVAVFGVVAAVGRRPALWAVAWRQLRRTSRPQWWRHRPFLPVPPAAYMRFRLVTQYGTADHRIAGEDVVSYLQWCKMQVG